MFMGKKNIKLRWILGGIFLVLGVAVEEYLPQYLLEFISIYFILEIFYWNAVHKSVPQTNIKQEWSFAGMIACFLCLSVLDEYLFQFDQNWSKFFWICFYLLIIFRQWQTMKDQESISSLQAESNEIL